jgi:membrane protein YdbS with pleckstrin-like domain
MFSMASEQNLDSGNSDPASGHNQAAGEGDRPATGTPSPTAGAFREEVAKKKANLEDYDKEEAIWEGGYSGKAMLGTWLLLSLVSVAAIIGSFLAAALTLPIALPILLVLWAIAGIVYAFRRFGVHYELTSQRFIHQTGILTRHTDRIEVIDIDDVSFQQGPVQRILGVGSILITSSDRSHPELQMQGIADVKSVAGLIDDIRRTERRRRSLHIESI